jgi:putative FmdB family regulatory protein
MPTYDYRCDGCEHEFEFFQSITSPVRRKCPECGELKLKRLIGTGGAVIFKGSGFYQTDYRSDSYKKAAEAEKKSAQDKTSKKKDKPAKAESKSPDSTKKKKKAD